MMSGATIQRMSNEQARRAARLNQTPYVPFDENEIRNYPTFPFPNIGSYRPKGWRLSVHWLVDKTGKGEAWELALTTAQLRDKLLEYDAKEDTYGYAIIEEGTCQCVLGAFKKIEPA